MNPQLVDYIKSARKDGHKDDDIKTSLTGSGWPADQVEVALKANLDLPLPPPPPPAPTAVPTVTGATDNRPTHLAVQNYFSTAGLDYLIMFISLWVTASSLGWVLHSAVDNLTGGESFYTETFSFASAALLVGLPLFGFFFTKVKKAEVKKPAMKEDLSRKKAVQLTLITTFLIGLTRLVLYVYQLLNSGNGDVAGGSFTGNLLHTLVTLLIAGTIFVYYWRDEHSHPDHP